MGGRCSDVIDNFDGFSNLQLMIGTVRRDSGQRGVGFNIW